MGVEHVIDSAAADDSQHDSFQDPTTNSDVVRGSRVAGHDRS